MAEATLSEPVVRHQRVVDRIRDMILSGEVVGGERLYEPALCEKLGVSRTPIREALIIIAEDGLIEYRPNRGYVVRAFTLHEILDAFVVRESLESLACRLAAERGIAADMHQHIRALLLSGDELLARPVLDHVGREALRDINVRFHESIVQAAANTTLIDSLRNVTRIPFSSSRVANWTDSRDANEIEILRQFHTQHNEIFVAISAGEGYRAESIARGHVASAATRFRNQFLAASGDSATATAHG